MNSEPISSERLAALWVQAQPKVAGFISALIRDPHVAEDILQNVAMIAVRKRAEYEPARPFIAWAIQIAKFEVLAHRRDLARQQMQFSDTLIEQVAEAYQGSATAFDARGDALTHCMRQIGRSDRELLRWRYSEGISVTEIATRVGKTAANTRMIFSRVRKALRECIKRRLGAAEGSE